MVQVHDFPPRITRGLLKYAHEESSKNHKAQVFRAFCRVAKESEEISLARVKEDPGIHSIFQTARQVEIYALKRFDKVIENTRKGHYRLTPLGQRLADVYNQNET